MAEQKLVPGTKETTEQLREGDTEHVLEEGEPHPRGTLFILFLFLAALIGFWGYMYLLLFYGG